MRYVLYLDDLDHPSENITPRMLSRYHSDGLIVIWAKDIEMSKWYIENYGMPEVMHLDHDLGEDCSNCNNKGTVGPCYCPECGGTSSHTAMRFLNWLFEAGYVAKYPAPGYYVHSDNVDGRKNIMAFMNSWNKLWEITNEEGG